MKSFRHIAFFMALATLASGCVKTEVSAPDREVSFSVGSLMPKTKAVEITEFTSFKSKGFLHAEGIPGTQNFFGLDGETITKTGSEWLPSHPYYWPKSDVSYINFVSWYDKTGAPSTVSETELEWSNRTIVAEDNILWADEAWRYNANTSNGIQYTGDATTQGVPTIFHHALSQVKFQAKANPLSDGTTSWTVTITDFVVSNVIKTGTLTLVNEDPTSNGTSEWWSMSTDATPVPTTPYWDTTGAALDTLSRKDVTTSLTVADTPVSIMAMRSVIPQSNEDITVSFNCNIRTNYNGGGYMIETVPVNINIKDFSGDTGLWAMNHQTTYTININPNTGKILFDPALTEDWSTSQNNLTYIE